MQVIHPLPTLKWVLSAQAEKTPEAMSPSAAWRQLRAPLLLAIGVAEAAVNESMDASIDVYQKAAAAKKAAIAADKEFCKKFPCPTKQAQWRHFSPNDPLITAIF
jgi:hypothetical protein